MQGGYSLQRSVQGNVEAAAQCPGKRTACSAVSRGTYSLQHRVQGNVQPAESLGQYLQAHAGSSSKRVGVRTREAGRGRDTYKGRLPTGTGGD